MLIKFFDTVRVNEHTLSNDQIEQTITRLSSSLTEAEHKIYLQQREEYKTGTIPNIADPALQSATVEENDDTFINLNEVNHPRIMMAPSNYIIFFGGIVTDVGFYMRSSLYERLVVMVDLLPEPTVIWVAESYRSIEEQEIVYRQVYNTYLGENPNATKVEAHQYTNKMVCPIRPNVIPPHSTGGAIDMLPAYKQPSGICTPLWEGKPGAMDGENDTSLTFDNHISDREQKLRLMFYLAALKAGLINYGNEFWHYSYGDRAWAAYTESPTALYGYVLKNNVLEQFSSEEKSIARQYCKLM